MRSIPDGSVILFMVLLLISALAPATRAAGSPVVGPLRGAHGPAPLLPGGINPFGQNVQVTPQRRRERIGRPVRGVECRRGHRPGGGTVWQRR
jgi:hypothetical protein